MLTEILYKYDSTGKIRTYQIEIDGDKYRMITGTKDGKKVESKWTVCIPKNVGKSNETIGSTQAVLEAKARIDKKLTSNYYKTEKECIENPEQFFQPMLATAWEKIKPVPQFPLLIDPKLDGMRLIVCAESYLSRKGKEVPAARWIYEELETFFDTYPNIILDGEIYTHELKDDFNTLMSIARRESLDDKQTLTAQTTLQYHVYDLYDRSCPIMSAYERKSLLEDILPVSDRVRLVLWLVAMTAEDLKAFNTKHVSDGYEGSIARGFDSIYENKRSKHLIKIKQFITEEFTVIDIVEGTGNRSGIAGSIEIDVDGIIVNAGIKGSWIYAKSLLDNKQNLIGKLATIRHFGLTPDGSLRFPVCIDVDRLD